MYYHMAQWVRLVRHARGAAVVGNSIDKILRLEVNESGFQILSLCNGRRTFENIVESLSLTSELDENDKNSVLSFLRQYVEMGILCENESFVVEEPVIVGSKNIILPISVGLEVTSLCQLKCVHCFNSSGNEMEQELAVDDFIALADKFIELGVVSFFITGGEPMLKPGLERLIDRLGAQFLTVSLISNGVFLPDRVLEALVRHEHISVRISIDGMKDVHDQIRGVQGTFDKAERNIRRLVDAGKNVSISFTLNDINRDELDPVTKHFKEIGCEGIAIGVTSNAGRAKDNGVPHGANRDYYKLLSDVRDKYNSDEFAVGLDICEEKVKQVLDEIPYPNKCGAGYSSIAIRPNGDVTPCTTMPKWIIGHADNLLDTLELVNLQKWMNRPTPTPELCGDCGEAMFCAYCLANMLESDAPCRLKEGWIK